MLAWLVFLSILGSCVAIHVWSYPSGDNQSYWEDGPCFHNGTANATSRQSPIDIDCNINATVVAPMSYKNYFLNNGKFNKWHKGLLSDNGHTVQWSYGENMTCPFEDCHGRGKCPSIQNGPFGANCTDEYYLVQLHFHWGRLGSPRPANKGSGSGFYGSEHRLCGENFPLEMHMVHVNKKYVNDSGCIKWNSEYDDWGQEWENGGALKDPKGLAVIGIFFCVDPMKHANQKPLTYLSDVVPEIEGPTPEPSDWMLYWKREVDSEDERTGGGHPEEQLRMLQEAMEELDANNHARIRGADPKPMKLRLNPGGFIRKVTLLEKCGGNCSTYFTYPGSLTTPGCNEVVTWVVFRCCLTITQVQLNAFATRYEDNFRDIDTCEACQANSDPTMNHLQHLIHNEIPFPNAGIFG